MRQKDEDSYSKEMFTLDDPNIYQSDDEVICIAILIVFCATARMGFFTCCVVQ